MRILYFEDDLIDQRLFKRACKNIPNLEVAYYESCLGLEENYINSYNGIIIDQYLSDCSAIQFQDKKITAPMAVLSASEKLNGPNQGFIGIWQKPIKENILKEILQKMKRGRSTAQISLEYIHELTEGNNAESKELLDTIYKSIAVHNQALANIDQLDAQTAQQHLHKQKSKIGIFYLEELHELIDNIENQLKNGVSIKSVKNEISVVVNNTNKVLEELLKIINL